MIHKLYRFYKLSPAERRILLEAALILPSLAIGLKLLGFRSFTSFQGSDFKCDSAKLTEAKEIASLVYRIANQLPFHSSCLVRSLALWRVLHNHHIASELLIGVGKSSDKQFVAHAWVEYQGTPLAERSDIETLYPRILATDLNRKSFS